MYIREGSWGEKKNSDTHCRTEKEIQLPSISRRKFVQSLAMVAVGGRTLLSSRDAGAAIYAAREAGGSPEAWPEMTYRKLGRTNFNASRLVFGCGAALMFRPKDALLNAAYDAGINVFDVGYRGYYRNAEEHLSPFINKVRDNVFLLSSPPSHAQPHTPR